MCPGSTHAPTNDFILSWFNSFSCRNKVQFYTPQCTKQANNIHSEPIIVNECIMKCAIFYSQFLGKWTAVCKWKLLSITTHKATRDSGNLMTALRAMQLLLADCGTKEDRVPNLCGTEPREGTLRSWKTFSIARFFPPEYAPLSIAMSVY